MDEGVHQCRGERVGQLERVHGRREVAVGGVDAIEQDVGDLGPQLHVVECAIEDDFLAGFGRQQSSVGDLGQVARGKFEVVEAAFLVRQRLAASFHGLADFGGRPLPEGQGVLAGDEGDQGDGEGADVVFDEKRQLLRFLVESRLVGDHERQPQDQFVEEQDDAVVPEGFRVVGDDLEALVQRQPRGIAGVGREQGFGQCGDQRGPLGFGGVVLGGACGAFRVVLVVVIDVGGGRSGLGGFV